MVQKVDIISVGVDWSSAKSLCKNSVVGGYTDWRLPTKAELAMLYQNKNVIGGFSKTRYWSSTEYVNDLNAWSLDFSSGHLSGTDKDYEYRVRAVRTN